MKVIVRHGHFAFYPHTRDEVLHFRRIFKLSIVPEADYFTFDALVGLPRWSQLGQPYGNLVALKTYEGRHASDVMRENDFVHSLATGLLVPTATITETIALPQSRDYTIAPKPLVQPGSLVNISGAPNVLLGYHGELDLGFQKLYIAALETLL